MRLALLVVLVVIVVTAGCVSTNSPVTSPTEPPTTEPPTKTTTVHPTRVVAFHDLNGQQQSAFRDALRGAANFVPNSSYINESEGYHFEEIEPFRTHDYVKYDGELYKIRFREGDLYASYLIRATIGSPDDDNTVAAFDSLPKNIRDEVRTAITEGEYYAPMGKWGTLPEPLQDVEYVRYENQTYKMGYTVGDAWGEVLTVEKVE